MLARMTTGDKNNETTTIPQLLDTVDIAGDTVTIDAVGCQKDIARKIAGRGLALY
jgi:predicted transposase YbfD/YdcC